MTTERVLITGGAGFIGANTAMALLRRGVAVTILDNLSQQIHGKDPERSPTFAPLRKHVRFVHGDVRDARAWDAALTGQDAVIHLAAETGTGQSMYEINRYSAVNIQGTATLLDRLVNSRNRVRRLVVASSRSIYGEGKYRCPGHGVVYPEARRPEDMERGDFAVKCPICGASAEMLPTSEDSAIRPSSVYAVTKATQEQMMIAVGRSIGVPAVALRYQNVYGPGQSLVNPYTGILSIFSGLLFSGGEINIFEDGRESRDFVFIDDIVEANLRALESEDAAYRAINVGSGIATSVLDVARELADAYGLDAKLKVTGAFRIGDIRHNVAQIDLCRQHLGFAPRYGFAEGIRRFAAWVVEQREQLSRAGDRYDASLAEMGRRNLFRQNDSRAA